MSSSTASRAPGSADELVPGTISANQVLLGTVTSRRRPHQHRQCSAKAAWHLTVPTTLPSAPRVPLATNLALPLRSRALEVPGSSPRAPPVPKSSPSAPRVPIATSPALSGTRSARQLAARTSSAHRSSTGSVGRGFQEATRFSDLGQLEAGLHRAFTEPQRRHWREVARSHPCPSSNLPKS